MALQHEIAIVEMDLVSTDLVGKTGDVTDILATCAQPGMLACHLDELMLSPNRSLALINRSRRQRILSAWFQASALSSLVLKVDV